MRKQIRDYAKGQNHTPVDLLFPSYFSAGPAAAGCAFVERIRQGPLHDELADQILPLVQEDLAPPGGQVREQRQRDAGHARGDHLIRSPCSTRRRTTTSPRL